MGHRLSPWAVLSLNEAASGAKHGPGLVLCAIPMVLCATLACSGMTAPGLLTRVSEHIVMENTSP